MNKLGKLVAILLGPAMTLSVLAACGGGDGGELDPLPEADEQAPVFSSADATFSLNGSTGSTPREISESLFGVFLEDINYAGYILDDNLLYNGGFERGSSGWITDGASINGRDGGALSSNEVYTSDVANVNPKYGEISVSKAGGKIENFGMQQVPVVLNRDTDYLFSAFIKADKAFDLTVRVSDLTDETIAEETVSVAQDANWVKYQQTVHVEKAAGANVRVELIFPEAGTYAVDAVSFETTNSTAGIKQYVYDAIKELAPKFIRFPGGCIIEGDADPNSGGANTTEVYDWKNSVGAAKTGSEPGDDDIPAFTYKLVKDGVASEQTTYGEWATRTPNLDLWGYDMEYGVGFYEFFELCDSLGAGAVPVLNCGLSDQGGAAREGYRGTALDGRHGNKVDDYIQDAIDLIEFAKGDTTTKWGALRAKMGHEEPFKMDYLGIGNEQFGVYYTGYYEKFLESDAFLEALETYHVKPIVGNGMSFDDCENTELVPQRKGTAQNAARDYLGKSDIKIGSMSEFGVHDHHYYMNYTYFFENTKLYDGYTRKNEDAENYYEVFVGEYSANMGDGSDKDAYNGPDGKARAGYPLTPNSLISALSEAAAMTGFERNGDIVKLAAYAPMFGVGKGGTDPSSGGNENINQWDVDMMYASSLGEIVRTANYYVQKMFMHNQGKTVLPMADLIFADGVNTYTLPAEGNADAVVIDRAYFSAAKGENGDLIVKIVNPTGDNVKLNFNITNATSRGFAYVTELSGEPNAFNTSANGGLAPVEHTVGWPGQSFGYELKAHSLTVLRVVVK